VERGRSLTDPPLVGEGNPGINEFADTVCEHYSGPRFRPVSGIDEVTVAGVDVGHTAPDGRLHDITGFFGDLPSM
jgi:hypothetical protein